jgi:hypothetical protein
MTRIEALLERFPPDQRHRLAAAGAVEVIGLGERRTIVLAAPAARAALARLDTYFDRLLSRVLAGVAVYVADGVIDSGGEALADENAVIIDATKARMSVFAVEAHLVRLGDLNPGDWSRLVRPDTTYGEITIVHELGHVLEARAHGQEGTALADLPPADAPTLYGRKGPREAYPETFFYDVYGGRLNPAYQAVVRQDVLRLS